MKRSTSFLVRVALMAAALALAVVFVGREAGSPAAEATAFNPMSTVIVDDPTPGAHSDLHVSFSVDYPDAFVNITDHPAIQFIPKQWGINTDAPPAAIAGKFDALATIGIIGLPCSFPIPFTPDMHVSSVDPDHPTSALDLPGSPGGSGFSGQFAQDPDSIEPPPDLGVGPLINFNADEKHTYFGPYKSESDAYRDVDGSNVVSPGDIRLTGYVTIPIQVPDFPAGSVVQAGDEDMFRILHAFSADDWHDETVAANGQMDPGEGIYKDVDGSGTVTYGDIREFELGLLPWGSTVEDAGLSGGITRYPDFLAEMFPPDVIGAPILRLWGGQNVVGTAVPLNIVIFAPGQLPGFPVSMGYPSVVVLLNPVAPVDTVALSLTSDLCTPLSLVNTNYGISRDNPFTFEDDGGIPLMTNPSGQKDHVFTLVTQSDYDADDDGIENWLDSCPFDANTEDLDGRSYDPDWDGLDGACDPDPATGSPQAPPPIGLPDEDQDFLVNRADLCPTVPNGVEVLDMDFQRLGQFTFPFGTYGGVIGPDNQADADGDRIGDACDPDPDTPTGHTHQVTLERTVSIYKHGIKLNNLGGPKNVQAGGAKTYSVPVSNLSDSPEEIQVALRVLEDDCATVNGAPGENTAVVSVGPGGSGSASFTVDWAECPDYEYTLQADACHAGDEDAGFFGVGDCPGESDGMVDNNADDDAPRTKIVTVGSP